MGTTREDHQQQGPPVFQWAQEHGEVGGVLTSHTQLTATLRQRGFLVEYVDTGSALRAARALPRTLTRRGLHLLHLTRLWRAVVLAPVFALLPGRTVLVLHSGSTRRQAESMSPSRRRAVWGALRAYDEIWAVNDEIRAVLPAALLSRTTVVAPFDPAAAPADPSVPRDPDALALATNAGLAHYNADLGIEAARLVRVERPDTTLHILAYGAESPDLDRLRETVSDLDWVRFSFDLGPAEVNVALASVGCFLRPTSWDGDSVIVREALALGTRVVASDISARPLGVELSALNAEDLAEAVLHGGRPSTGEGLTSTGMSAAVAQSLRAMRSRGSSAAL